MTSNASPSSSPAPVLTGWEAARQRQAEALEAHCAWKRRFFLARPPPPARERRHRQNHGEGRYTGVGSAFATAVSIAQRLVAAGEPPAEAETEAAAATPLTRRERWLAKMRQERAERNPYADVEIRSDPRRTVVFSNLPADAAEADLRHFADQFGRVTDCRLVRCRRTGRSRRYAFIEFGLEAEARKAVRFSKQRRLRGRLIAMEAERGRCDHGFLPQRLATAAALEAEAEAAAQRRQRGRRVDPPRAQEEPAARPLMSRTVMMAEEMLDALLDI